MEGEEGRRARFEGVFRKHQAAVRAYALRRADHARAQDAVSETFLIAWRRFDDLPEEPLPWLFGTTRRVLANQRRAEGHQRSVADRVAAEPAASAPDPAQLLGDAGALLCALGRLGAQDRETLTLVAWEGLDPGAAAARAVAVERPSP